MRRRFSPIAYCGFITGTMVVAFLFLARQAPSTVAAEDAASEPKLAGAADNASEAGVEAEQQELNIKYAKTYLQLTQVNLQKALDFNKRVPGAFSEAEVERLRRLVAYADERLKWIQKASRKQSDANMFTATVALQSADNNYQRAKSANTRVPGAVSPLELERLRLTTELAQMSIEKARLAAATNSLVDDVQWELDQLREDVMQLRSRVEAITSRR